VYRVRLEPRGIAIRIGREQLRGQGIAAEVVRKGKRTIAPGGKLGASLADQAVLVIAALIISHGRTPGPWRAKAPALLAARRPTCRRYDRMHS
jgi:hypothetical protein